MPKFALQIHTFYSSFFLEYICIIARSEKFDYFDPVTKLFFPSLFSSRMARIGSADEGDFVCLG